ncbi:hypothetical protein [Actinokineospora pegani]|uniref:hypothetical protein n=1 Tax=Actinokineospora pegani TaxID=2654637 RepID=UPI0012EAAABC|nr:hypothetical protein [Actinokineospora pegani]
MEPWRLFATALLVVAGLVLLLVVMAKVRDRTGRPGPTAMAGAVAFTVLALLCLLAMTVLPEPVAWGAVAVVGTAAAVLVLVG